MSRKKTDLNKCDGLQEALFQPKGDWRPPNQFPCLTAAKRIAFDFETRDPFLKDRGPGFIRGDASVAGVSLAVPEGQSWYFPFGHLGGGNLDKGMVVAFLKDAMALPCEKVGANLSYDLEAAWSLGVQVKGRLLDVQIAEPLIEEEREEGYSLNSLCKIHLGMQKEETLLREAAEAYGLDPKGSLWKLHSKYVGAYASWDAACCLQILEKQERELSRQSLDKVWDLETRLVPVLHAMRIRGIPICLERAGRLTERLAKEELAMQEEMEREFGHSPNVNSGMEIAKACDKMNLDYPRTKQGFPSFKADWLEAAAATNPFFEAVLDLRQLRKLRETFVNKWIFENHVNGRIHPTWRQMVSDEGGTRTGRMAAADPNPQQIPSSKRRSGKPNPVGAEIRGLFRPETGGLWAKIDYAGQEPRILVHFAALCGYAGAEAAAFAFRANPDIDFYTSIMCPAVGRGKEFRRPAKTIFLGICYGMGKDKLAASLNKSRSEAEHILAEIDSSLPFIRQISDKCTQLASDRGFVRTLLGRRRHFNYWEPANAWQLRKDNPQMKYPPLPREKAEQAYSKYKLARAQAHKGLNAVIQGSAADMMKAGLVDGFEREGRVPHITVHDEVGGTVRDEADAQAWLRTMENCVEMCVPIRGELEIGESWK